MKQEKEYYLVETLDEWNNSMLYGLFDNLDTATKEIQDYNSQMKGIEELQLNKYASTFNESFNQELYDEDSGECLKIFGYILTKKQIKGLMFFKGEFK